jgi:dihydroorotate dehydrogenase (NAD+) catalytic subunit
MSANKKRASVSKKTPGLGVTIGSIRLKNPVMTASGTFGYGLEYEKYTDLARLGAIIVKGLSLKPRLGNPGPRIVETPCGMLNAIGLQNVGVESFIKNKLPLLRKIKTRVIVNIFGETVGEYARVAERLDSVEGVAGVEINISCPNVKKGGAVFGIDPASAARVVRAVRKSYSSTVITKLSPSVSDIGVMAKAVEEAGSDAISLINTIPGMVVDIKRRRPMIAMGIGGLSGPAIRPIAVRMVWEAYRASSVPIIGIGGIVTARDALEFIIAGASAIQVGSASFVDPDAAVRVADGIARYVKSNKTTVRKLVGTLEF